MLTRPQLYKGDSFHIMPIITPAYPSMCATFNITKSSLTVIQRELHRASETAQLIIAGRKQWKDLFERHSFFTQDFKYYLSVISSSTDKETHKVWSGFVESKVRMLVQGLERHPSIALARPFNKGYERSHRCKNTDDIKKVQNGSLDCVVQKSEQAEVETEAKEVKAKLEDSESPLEQVNGIGGAEQKADSEESEVYTMTHYIGVELADGKCQT